MRASFNLKILKITTMSKEAFSGLADIMSALFSQQEQFWLPARHEITS